MGGQVLGSLGRFFELELDRMRASQQFNALGPRLGFVEDSMQIHDRGNGLVVHRAEKIALVSRP
jgi:hypothetical protein